MLCTKFELLTSAYVDRRLLEQEAVEFHAHRSECADCRTYLIEVEEMSLVLRRSIPLEIPVELRGYVMADVEMRARKEIGATQLMVKWLHKFNPRAVAYATGLMASTVLFVFLLSGVKPIPVMEDGVERAAILPVITGSDPEYHAYNDLPADPAAAGNDHYYELPRVLDNSALVSFSHIAYQKAGGDEGMAALVEVGADGSARLVDVLDYHSDPYLVEQLWWSLSNRTFQPAMVEGHATPTRIVLLVEKMDVGG